MIRRAALGVSLVALLVVTPRDAVAYRPFDGTDADVAAEGEFELELGPAQVLWAPGGTRLITPATVWNLGFAPGFELVIDAKNVVSLSAVPGEPRDQVQDTDVLVKAILRRGVLQGGKGLSIATELGPLTPELGGQSGFGAQVALITSYRWPGLTLHLNTLADVSRAHEPGGFASLIAEGPERWGLRPVAEIAAQTERTRGSAWSALGGAVWEVNDRLALDAAFRGGRGDDGTTREVRLGLTWTLPVWGGDDASAASRARLTAL